MANLLGRSAMHPGGGRMPASSPAAAPISTTCASTAWRMPWCCARRTPTRGSSASMSTAARAMPGVLAVLTGDGCAADGLQPMRPTVEANVQTGETVRLRAAAVAGDRQGAPCRRTGRADCRRDARAGAGCGGACGRRLRAAAGGHHAADALCAGAPQIADEVPGNVCMDWRWGDAAAVDAAFAAAAHVVSLRLDNHRIVTNPMEPRGAIGIYDAARTATRCMSPARTSTATATPPRARWACRRPMCGSSRPMSAAASARRTSPTPSMR